MPFAVFWAKNTTFSFIELMRCARVGLQQQTEWGIMLHTYIYIEYALLEVDDHRR